MQNSLSLNTLYANYAAGLLEKEKLETTVFEIIQEDIHRLGLPGWNREDRDDYVSWLYGRIGRAISAYRETGSSFETYISTMVRLTVKEYRSRQIRGNTKESAAWIVQMSDMYVCENETEYDEQDAEKIKGPVNVKNPRQILILILKCSNYVSTDFLEWVSPSLGVDPEELHRMISFLKEQRGKRETEIAMMRERTNRQFYRCIFLEKNLKAMVENSIAAQRLKEKLEEGRDKLNKMRRRLARTRLDPSNSQIAEILGISKGTVDTVLFNLRTQWNNGIVLKAEPLIRCSQKIAEWTEEKNLHL